MKSPEVIAVLNQAHQHYANAEHYTHFIVLTQSCDLVNRGNGIKAPYISIAAVTPLSRVVGKDVEGALKSVKKSDFPFLPARWVKKKKEFLERLIHNTEENLFFLPAVPECGPSEDSVAHLRLSVALRTDHYPALLGAKIVELEDVFQAKLGWLVGNIYSRVGTPDIESRDPEPDTYKKNLLQRHIPLEEYAVLTGLQATSLARAVRQTSGKLKRELTSDEVKEILEASPKTDVEIAASEVVDTLVRKGLLSSDAEIVRRAINAVSNDPTMIQLGQPSQL